MALHLRDQILDALATLLTGLTTTGSRVYVDRDPDTEPLSDAELPGLTIRQLDESIETLTLGYPRQQSRFVSLEVAAFSKLTTSTAVRKQMNLIEQEILVAIGTDRSLAGKCKYITHTGADWRIDGDTDKPQGRATLSFQVFYVINENAPDTAQ